MARIASAGRSAYLPLMDETLALRALATVIGDDRLRDRFLALTGLSPDELRQSAGDPGTLAALLDFLAAHEPDLMLVAERLGVKPEALCARF